ncbi:hypothetical protein ACFYY8_30860 [Streptosporangium sp. NPDC001559]|uniref:hypothetical protein n=1 Tax=Streptosporangium sp. NPDC001559 TaxID=3366187 RepID=UPI0036E65DF0
MLDRLLSSLVMPAALLTVSTVACAAVSAGGTAAEGTGSVGDCGPSLTFSGSAFGYLDNGTLSAGFCVKGRSLRRINVAYDKARGGATNVRLGYQRTDGSGVGIKKPVYGPAVTARAGGTTFRSFSLALPSGCYHGIMLNTATRFQYVTKVWGDC